MIELRRLSIRSGTFALDDVSLQIPEGQYAVLMGGTGQGKTTILEAICGLRTVAAGEVRLAGQNVTRWKPADRGVGYVPQDLALFPTLSVRGHLEFALRVRRWPADEIQRRVSQLSEELGIAHLLERGVGRLSGGEAQRVALGRALAFRPRVLLMDALSLGRNHRDRLCGLLRSIQRSNGLTTLHVTHSRSKRGNWPIGCWSWRASDCGRSRRHRWNIRADARSVNGSPSDGTVGRPAATSGFAAGAPSTFPSPGLDMNCTCDTGPVASGGADREEQVTLPGEPVVGLDRAAAGRGAHLLTSSGQVQPSLLIVVNDAAVPARETSAAAWRTSSRCCRPSRGVTPALPKGCGGRRRSRYYGTTAQTPADSPP